MSTLIIRKKSLKTWLHTDSILGNFIISKFYFNADNVSFQIVEQGQSRRVIYNISDITIYALPSGGTAETFTTITELSLRLEELNYPAFQYDGQITSIANLIDSGTNVTITGDGTLASPYIISATGGGGGSQTLAETLVLGNITDGTDISISDGDAIALDNTSKLKKGTTNAGNGGNNGIALKCSLDYEFKWEAGRMYIMEQDGIGIRETRYNFNVSPTTTDDSTKGFAVNSRWILDNGDIYVCTDATTGSAVWELQTIDLSGYVPFDGDPTDKFASLNKITSNDVVIGNDSLDNETFIDVNYDLRFIKSIVTEPLDPSFSQILQTNNNYNISNQQFPSGLFSILFPGGQTKLGGDDNYFSTDESIGIKGFTYNDINFAQINIPSGVIGYDTNTQSAYLGDNFNDATGAVIKVLGTSSEININAETITANGSSILPLVKNGSFSAKNEEQYIIVNGTCTVTDPTGYLGKGYKVYVRDGSAIIGGVTYGVGSLVYRFYGISTWTSTDFGAGGGATNLGYTPSPTDGTVTSDTGTDATLPLADGTNAGLLSPSEKTLIASIPNINTNAVDKITVKLALGITKGQAVYISSANGTNIIVSKASNTSEATSSKTLGLLETTGATNAIVNVVTNGLLDGLDTSTATVGDAVWLGTSGNLLFGLANKPYAPAHLVYIGVVSRVSATVGEIIVSPQNGFELKEIHDVDLVSNAPTNNQALTFETSSSLWKNKSIIEDAIVDGVTTIAPSQNAVFDALSSKESNLTISTGLTRSTNTVTNNLSTGIAGSQSVIGGTAASETLTLYSTSNATKGKLLFGTSAYDEVNNRLGITNTTPTSKLHIITDALGTTNPPDSSGLLLENTTLSTAGTYQNSPSLVFASHGWGLTTFDRLVKWKIYSSPIYGSNTEVLPSLKFDFSIAGGAYVSSGLSLDRDRFGSFTLTSCPISTTGFSSNGTASMLLGNAANATAALIVGGNAYSYLAGETARAAIVQAVTVASGTGIYNAIGISGAINQTGTASGITRGFYHNPTLTAAVDYRAIESTNGKVILTDTFSAGSGALAGSLLDLRQTWNTTGSPTAIKLNITNTAVGATPKFIDFQFNGTSRFSISSGAVMQLGDNSSNSGDYRGSSLNLGLGGSGTAIADTISINTTKSPTSGTYNSINSVSLFSPTSGTAVYNAFTFGSTINQTGGANGISRGLYINPTLTSAFDFRAIEVTGGKIVYPSTITAAGTTGAQTINKISGKVNAAAATTSLVVTNSLVTTSSIVMCQLGTNDATCDIKSVVEAAGSFTINYTAPTAETVIKFTVIN